jgi:hypothetical protein
MFSIKKHFILIWLLIILVIFKNCFALDEHARLWPAINSQQTLSKDKKWLSFIYSRFQFIDQSHPWQAILLESGIGYKLAVNQSIWLGYRWTGQNPYNDFYTENRLFQQIIWEEKLDKLQRIIFRSRLEEIQRTNQRQISLRFRERIAFEWWHLSFFNKISPFVYDEVFFQLTKTDYTTHDFFSENRIFIGFNFLISKSSWWEVGYINQFNVPTPSNNQDQMSHILSITYNFS